jgi:hypothetical protein
MRGLSIALAMTATEAQALVKYVTNAEGQTTDVLVPLSVWEALLEGMSVVKDCGPENEQLATWVAYLLTDERGTRPLKTRSELERELEELLPSVESTDLDLVLAVLVGSGLVLRSKEMEGDRYQLVHDYLAGIIHEQQKPKFQAELAEEREQRQKAENQLTTATQKLKQLEEKNREAEDEFQSVNKQLQRRIKLGIGTLTASIGIASITGISAIRAVQMQQEAQMGTRLEREGISSMEQFKGRQTEAVLSAMRSVDELRTFEQQGRSP